MFSRLPPPCGQRLSTTATWWPCARYASTMCEPIKPIPPVTSILKVCSSILGRVFRVPACVGPARSKRIGTDLELVDCDEASTMTSWLAARPQSAQSESQAPRPRETPRLPVFRRRRAAWMVVYPATAGGPDDYLVAGEDVVARFTSTVESWM